MKMNENINILESSGDVFVWEGVGGVRD